MVSFDRLVMTGAALALALACSSRDRESKSSEAAKAEAAAWAQLEQSASPTIPPGDSAHLSRAAALLEPHRELVDELWEADDRDCVEADFPAEVGQAVAALVAWHEAGGGVERVGCPEVIGDRSNAIMDLMSLMRAALLQTDRDIGHRNVAAVLYMGHRLREEGTTLLHAAVGSAMSSQTVDWALGNGLSPTPAFAELRPRRALVLRALAAEAVCQVRLAERLREDYGGYKQEMARRDIALPDSPGAAWAEAEIAAVRDYSREMVRRGQAHRDDKAALVAALTEHAEQAGRDKQRVVLQVLAVTSLPGMIGDLVAAENDYGRYVDGERSAEIAAAAETRKQACEARRR